VSGSVFYCVEIETYRDGAGSASGDVPTASVETGADPGVAAGVVDSSTAFASDLGYRTRPTDSVGLRVYPPLVEEAFSVNRVVPLPPGQVSAYSVGTVTLSNVTRFFDNLGRLSNADGRTIRILRGLKVPDATRGGYETDPVYASLSLAFKGLGVPWSLGEDRLELRVRDASYWLERPYQQSTYAGTGGREGTAAMTGTLKPRVRGGTASAPVREVRPVLVDPAALIYAVSDAPGSIIALYEGGDTGIAFQASVADLYVGTTNPGQYRVESGAAGLFIQLGSRPTRTITVDVVGNFAAAGAQSAPAAVARYILTEDLNLPSDLIDTAAFSALATAYPYVSGWSWQDNVEGVEAADIYLASAGLKLITTRSGVIRPIALRAIPAGSSAAGFFNETNIVSLRPVGLVEGLDPPAQRWRIGHTRTHTTQTSDLDPDVTEARRQTLANEYRYAISANTAIIAAYRRPIDPEPVPTALLREADAAALAAAMRDLWSVIPPRRLFEIDVPMEFGLAYDIGDIIHLTYPVAGYDAGGLCQIVGESLRTGESTISFRVLA
jgi:hypothetical protein